MEELGWLGHLFVCVFLYHFSAFMVIPAITDITMAALCPGKDQCSLAIYLSGFQQAITGMGTLMITPIVGNLSDEHGRKALLTIPMTISIIPLAILAYSRTTSFFYVYYVIRTFAGMFCESSMQCLTLAYVADRVGEGRRASAFGILSGVSAAGFVSGTIAARFISTSLTFQVSAIVAILAAVYMKLFLAESDGRGTSTDASIPASSDDDGLCEKLLPPRRGPSLSDMICLLRSSMTFSQAAIIAFCSSLSESGLQASLLYFLKARFHFNKDQFADLLLIIGLAGVFSQLILMPILVPTIGEEKLLSIALLASCAHVFLYSIAWASWVPYFAAMFVVISIFTHPCLRSIISKKVGPNEQGMAQGCVSGVTSFASVVAPLAFTPLTALFLSDRAPFYFPGFSLMCIGFAMLSAFIQSLLMTRAVPLVSSVKNSNDRHVQP